MTSDLRAARFPPPRLTCRRVRVYCEPGLPAVQALFREAEACDLRQAWLAMPEERFRPASVRCGWDDAHLWVFAGLADDDMFNPVLEFNAPTFMHGDAFEMFLKPVGQVPYYEFHVSPLNQKFQLRIASPSAIGQATKIYDPVIGSRVWCDTAAKVWHVLASIPLRLVSEAAATRAQDEWQFSFSRYDYTRGQDRPVLSSSSPHAQVGFHRQQEWGTLRFV